MKVKKSKHSDIVDALKHLKISDRRFRPSLKGCALQTLTSLGEVPFDRRPHFRMTRSASSAAAINCEMSYCSICEFCNAFCRNDDGVWSSNRDSSFSTDHHQSSCCTELSSELTDTKEFPDGPLPTFLFPLSSFTKSAGLLHTTLPSRQCYMNYNVVKPDNLLFSTSNCEQKNYRRSFGTELSYIEREHRHHTSIMQSPNSINSATPHGDNFCNCHHDGNHLPHQLRLYRRLYSLVDHPCVSLYYPCRHIMCRHATVPRGCSSGYSVPFRHSLRHRHTIAPASLFRFNTCFRTSSCSKSPDTESELGAGDNQHFNQHKGIIPSLQLHSSILSQSSSVFRSGSVKPPTENMTLQHCWDQEYSVKCNNKSGSIEEQGSGSSRCRRSSDPEHWQQVRSVQVSKSLVFSTEARNKNLGSVIPVNSTSSANGEIPIDKGECYDPTYHEVHSIGLNLNTSTFKETSAINDFNSTQTSMFSYNKPITNTSTSAGSSTVTTNINNNNHNTNTLNMLNNFSPNHSESSIRTLLNSSVNGNYFLDSSKNFKPIVQSNYTSDNRNNKHRTNCIDKLTIPNNNLSQHGFQFRSPILSSNLQSTFASIYSHETVSNHCIELGNHFPISGLCQNTNDNNNNNNIANNTDSNNSNNDNNTNLLNSSHCWSQNNNDTITASATTGGNNVIGTSTTNDDNHGNNINDNNNVHSINANDNNKFNHRITSQFNSSNFALSDMNCSSYSSLLTNIPCGSSNNQNSNLNDNDIIHSHNIPNDNNKLQPSSDLSVNELAAYMEHMVHIPGRMSEMAQRMYL